MPAIATKVCWKRRRKKSAEGGRSFHGDAKENICKTITIGPSIRPSITVGKKDSYPNGRCEAAKHALRPALSMFRPQRYARGRRSSATGRIREIS